MLQHRVCRLQETTFEFGRIRMIQSDERAKEVQLAGGSGARDESEDACGCVW
jgi:hypothetical protein